jgi:hypothetical protein
MRIIYAGRSTHATCEKTPSMTTKTETTLGNRTATLRPAHTVSPCRTEATGSRTRRDEQIESFAAQALEGK